MAKKSNKKKGPISGEYGNFTGKVVEFVTRFSAPITILLLIIILALGVYIRIIPALKYGIELDANDPWIVYWEAKYFVENGLTSLEGLTNVKDFWWPVGRDFLHTEYIGMAWLAAASYPIGEAFGLTLKEWVALFPVFAGAATIILLFVTIHEVTRSKLGALGAAAFFALMPGAIVRTTVGFVEKIGFSIPFITAHYLMLYKTVKASVEGDMKRTIIYGVIAGALGGSIGWLWGGYHYVVVSLALIVVLDPLVFGKPSFERFRAYLVTAIPFMLVLVSAPRIKYSYFITNVGAGLTGSIILYYLELMASRSKKIIMYLENGIDRRIHAWIIIVVVAIGFFALYSGLINLNNPRILQSIGIRNISPLQESVQENQPTSIQVILQQYGVPLLLGLAGFAAYLSSRIAMKSKPTLSDQFKLFFYIFMIIAVLLNKQLSYYTQISTFYAILAAGIGIADLTSGSISLQHTSKPKSKKKIKKGQVSDPLRLLISIFIIVIILFSGIYFGKTAYTQNSYRAPQILTSGLGALTVNTPDGTETVVPLNNAWLNALDWIKNNTSEDALIISWWDYGFWITVNTGRKTVADGATWNETQIRYLAELLTGEEGTASYILSNIFKAEPGNTYIVFYEVFNGIYDMTNNVTILYPMLGSARQPQNPGEYGIIVHGVADFGKSVQMLKISYRIPPFSPTAPFFTTYSSEYVDNYGYRYLHFPGFIGEPQQNVTTVLNALLYKLALNGILQLKNHAIFDSSQCASLIENSTLTLPYVVASLSGGGQLSQQPIIPPPTKYFKPAAISVACPVVNQNPTTQSVSFTAVIVYIYQWTG